VLRKEKNLTQEQLAEQLGVSGRTVSRWETGNNMPDISLLVEIAEFYEVTIPELINGERKKRDHERE
jgi:Predicted transcriptional regulators